MDGWLLAAELCGKDMFSQEELAAASQSSSRTINPSGSSTSTAAAAAGNSTTSGGTSSSSSASFFYVRRHTAKFHVLSLAWDPLAGQRLLVVGYQQAQPEEAVRQRAAAEAAQPGDAEVGGG
ncbi:hypothetical protein OEZ85_010482 [Tetradesmus obliquus]|uniref:Uncharacterized protein n=1 Tax=Tetradesmus obliquus TaxID=3088 RepID=A0ABY8TME8_TETOB|nr:hypothetical protein OEZ85_010482 [Tetradesmus obliquus]